MLYEVEPEIGYDAEKEAIYTSQSDIGFVMYMLLNWARHSQKNTFRFISEMPSWMWQDVSLKSDGITIPKNSMFARAESLVLRKVEPHYWVIDGFSALETEELVQKLKR